MPAYSWRPGPREYGTKYLEAKSPQLSFLIPSHTCSVLSCLLQYQQPAEGPQLPWETGSVQSSWSAVN